ncbi:hypothetical protein B9G55_11145 [Saccharibacillus sp. O16]|nr:hypothetical protein B9G55_11145 [Saccharibacillus sp. O16]
MKSVIMASGVRKSSQDENSYPTKGKVSLRALFSGLVVLTFLMTLAITLLASYHSEKTLLQERTLEANQRESQRVAHAIDMLFTTVEKSLQAFAEELGDSVSLGASQQTAKQLHLLYESSGRFDSVFVAGADGKVLDLEMRKDGEGAGSPDDAFLQAAVKAGKEYHSPFYTDSQGDAVVLVSEPIYDANQKYMGIIGGILCVEHSNVLGGLLGSGRAASNYDTVGSYSYIVDAQGRLIYDPNEERNEEEAGGNLALSHGLSGASGSLKVTDKDNGEYLVGYTFGAKTGWGVVAQTSAKALQAEQFEQMRGTLIVVMGPFLLLACAALFLARRLAAPFVSLADFVLRAVDRPEDEALPSVRRHWNREADLLNRAVMRTVREMKRQNRDLNDFALKDPLTGLLNRRALDEVLEKLEGDNRPFSLLLMDIDRFKSVNDHYGHSAGDEVLRSVARILEQTVGSRDLCGRYGGEEFLVLLPGRNLPETYEMAERIRLAVASHENALHIPVTLSIGASICPMQSMRVDDLFELADRALYRAKEGGRNRVVV